MKTVGGVAILRIVHGQTDGRTDDRQTRVPDLISSADPYVSGAKKHDMQT